jgi:hypothetical protein
MANINMTPSGSNTAGSGVGSHGVRHGCWEAFIDIADVLATKESALAQGDLIQVFDIPAEMNVLNGQIKVIEAFDSTTCTLNLGTDSDDDQWVDGLDATAVGYGTSLCANEYFATANTVDVDLETLTGTLTKGKIWVCVTWEYLGLKDSIWPS